MTGQEKDKGIESEGEGEEEEEVDNLEAKGNLDSLKTTSREM